MVVTAGIVLAGALGCAAGLAGATDLAVALTGAGLTGDLGVGLAGVLEIVLADVFTGALGAGLVADRLAVLGAGLGGDFFTAALPAAFAAVLGTGLDAVLPLVAVTFVATFAFVFAFAVANFNSSVKAGCTFRLPAVDGIHRGSIAARAARSMRRNPKNA
ncbi:MAG: hypothetical protein H7Z21_01280 [Hymenobacter sp.]|nr:hypothetical protein [Hymenobacter sp.]